MAVKKMFHFDNLPTRWGKLSQRAAGKPRTRPMVLVHAVQIQSVILSQVPTSVPILAVPSSVTLPRLAICASSHIKERAIP